MTVTASHYESRVRSARMFDDTWDRIGERDRDRSQFIRDMTDAGLQVVRCFRCFEPVKVEFGDLTGKPLAQWVEEAGKEVTRQHRDGHHPITVGRDTGEPPAARTVPSRPASATAVFLEPGGSPVITAAVPEVPAQRRKKGRRP